MFILKEKLKEIIEKDDCICFSDILYNLKIFKITKNISNVFMRKEDIDEIYNYFKDKIIKSKDKRIKTRMQESKLKSLAIDYLNYAPAIDMDNLCGEYELFIKEIK